MRYKIKVVIKRPDETFGHKTSISPRLENLQKTVGGELDVIKLTDDIYITCNKNAKSEKMPPNMKIGLFDVICGNIIVCGKDEEGFDSLPIDFQTWKRIVNKWND